MTEQSSFRRFGDLKLPVHAFQVGSDDLFSAFDPAVSRLIDFCKTVIVAELGEGWDRAKTTLTNDDLRTVSVVEDTCYTEPRRSLMREANFTFPLLAVYRTEEKHDLRNLRERQAKTTFMIDYILPPLPAEDERRVIAVLNAVAKCLTTAFEDQGHPAFNGGRAAFFYTDRPREAIFASIGTSKVRYGRAALGQDGEGVEFPVVQLTVEATETDSHLSDGDDLEAPFTSVNGKLNVGGSEGNVPGLVEIEAPTPEVNGEFERAVADFRRDLESGVDEVLAETKAEVRDYVSSSSQFSRQTGSPALARAVRARLAKRRLAMWVQGTVPRALEFGARPHLIPQGNRVIHHPGHRAFFFLGQAVEQAGEPFFFRRMRQMAEDVASRF